MWKHQERPRGPPLDATKKEEEKKKKEEEEEKKKRKIGQENLVSSKKMNKQNRARGDTQIQKPKKVRNF